MSVSSCPGVRIIRAGDGFAPCRSPGESGMLLLPSRRVRRSQRPEEREQALQRAEGPARARLGDEQGGARGRALAFLPQPQQVAPLPRADPPDAPVCRGSAEPPYL